MSGAGLATTRHGRTLATPMQAAPAVRARRGDRRRGASRRWQATPRALAAWAVVTAIVVAGQLLVPDRGAAGIDATRPAPSAPATPSGPTIAPDAVPPAGWTGPVALLAEPSPLRQAWRPAASGAPAASPAPVGAVPPVAARVATTARPPEQAPAGRDARPMLPYLGARYTFASPLLMPRLRDGLRVALPVMPKLPSLQRLLARPRPGEAVPVLITAYCLKGTTRRGLPVRPGIIAADPKVFPLARHVELYAGGRFLGRYLVDDTGGKIRGQRIDIWTPDCGDAIKFGARRGVATLVGVGEVRRTAQAGRAD